MSDSFLDIDMALLPCPSCDTKISTKATACPKCGDPLQPGWVQKTRRKRRWIAAVTAALFGTLLLIIHLVPSSEETPELRERRNCGQDGQGLAYLRAKNIVRGRLKSPTTAEFPDDGHTVVNKDRCKFWVKGYVDAQNSFGAKLRAPYFVELVYVPGTDTWLPTDVDVH